MPKYMVVDRKYARTLDLSKPDEALRRVYQIFRFSPDVTTRDCYRVAALVDVNGKKLGGVVNQADFNASFDPISFRAKRVLVGHGVQGRDPHLQEARVGGNQVTFVFGALQAVGTQSRSRPAIRRPR